MSDEANRVRGVRQTTIRLDESDYLAVEAQAKARGIKPGTYMRVAIEARLARDRALSGDAEHLAGLVAATAKEVDQLAAQLADALKR